MEFLHVLPEVGSSGVCAHAHVVLFTPGPPTQVWAATPAPLNALRNALDGDTMASHALKPLEAPPKLAHHAHTPQVACGSCGTALRVPQACLRRVLRGLAGALHYPHPLGLRQRAVGEVLARLGIFARAFRGGKQWGVCTCSCGFVHTRPPHTGVGNHTCPP